MARTAEMGQSLEEVRHILSRSAALAARARNLLADPQRTALEVESTTLQASGELPIRIAVLGPFSAGKSTFLNAIVGRFTRSQNSAGYWVYKGPLPSDRQIKTAVCTTVRHTPDQHAEHVDLTYSDGHVGSVSPKDADRYISLESTSSSIISKVRQFLSRPHRVVSATFFVYMAPWLRRVMFVDTPGLDSRADGHSDMALGAVHTADAVLYLVDEAINDADRRALIDIKDYVSQVIFVQTKADLPEEGLSSRMASNARAVKAWLNIPEEQAFVPVSSTWEMASLSGDAVPDSGFAELRRRIEDVMMASIDLRIRGLKLRVTGQLAGLSRLLDEKVSAANDSHDDSTLRVHSLRTNIDAADSLGVLLDDGYDQAKRDLVTWLTRQRGAWVAMMTSRTANDRKYGELCATIIQREARINIFDNDIRPHVRRELARMQDETIKTLHEKMGATLRRVDLNPGDVTLTKPIISTNIFGRFFRWMTNTEIPESSIREAADEAYSSILNQVLDKLDDLVRLLKQNRAQSQAEQQNLLRVRLDQLTAEHTKKTEQTVLARQNIEKLRSDIAAESLTLSGSEG